MIIKDPCKNCGSLSYYYWRVSVNDKGDTYEECSECSKEGAPCLSPDVYFDGSKGAFQTDPNICEKSGQQIPFSSKREKAAILRRLGLREAGDKEHGSRNFDKHSSKQWENFK